MLPGFRFLFTAIVLSMSILVFGLGAAALLRAAHEEFASNPSWRHPDTMFAQQAEATRPVLAMLRTEPPAAAQAPDSVPAVAAPAEPAANVPAPAEHERIAALKPQETSVPEAEKPEIPVPESRAQNEAAAAQADALSVADIRIAAPDAETKVASTEQASPPAQILSPSNVAAPVAAELASGQMSTQASPESDAASTKIATLGGPPVTIETPAKAVSEKPDESAIKKRLQARRAAHRRRMAARARLAARQAQLQANPFAQPLPQPPAVTRR